MIYPTFTTMLVGVVLMAGLLGIDWFVWGRMYVSDVRRKLGVVAEPKREQPVFKEVA